MLTAANTTRGAQTFMKAPNNTAFGKVFLNNMDRNSFISDKEKQLAMMISNGKTAMYNIHDTISAMQEYRNCQVSKKLIHL